MVLARLLLPEAFGLVATITVVTSFAEVLSDAGFQKYIIQHDYKSNEDYSKIFSVAFWSNLMLSLIVFSVVFAFNSQIASLMGTPQLGVPIVVASIGIVLNSYSSLQMAAYKREFDFKILFKLRMVISIVPIIVTIPLAIVLKSFWALVIGTLAHSLVQMLFFVVKPKVKLRLFYSFKLFKEMFSFTSWTLLESISIWLTANVDIFIIGRILNEYYLGLYKTSLVTVTSYFQLFTASVIPVLFSALSRYKDDSVNFSKTYNLFQRRLALIVFPMGFGMFLFKETVTLILLGNNWLEAAEFIGLISLVQPFVVCVCYFISEVFRSKGEPMLSLIYQCCYIAVLAPVIYYSSKQGFTELCYSKAACSLVFVAFALAFGRARYKIKISGVFKNILPQIISSVAMCFIGYGLLKISDNIFWQIIVVIVCMICYFAIVCIFKETRSDLFEIIKYGKIRPKTEQGDTIDND